MENKYKEYGSIALIVFVSISAFYLGKFAVESAFNYYNYRNQPASSLPNTTITNGDVDSARIYMQYNPDKKEELIGICVDAYNKEAVKQNMVGVFSDASVRRYCECAMEDVKNGKTFDESVNKCVKQELTK